MPRAEIAALLREADPDQNGWFQLQEFVTLVCSLNPIKNLGELAAERETARNWQRSRMLKERAVQSWRATCAMMEMELLHRMVTR